MTIGLSDADEHDEALVRAWNDVVGAEDEVWHLGDFALGPPRCAGPRAARKPERPKAPDRRQQ
jgi:calcineurin-like phosphoesterase family protein